MSMIDDMEETPGAVGLIYGKKSRCGHPLTEAEVRFIIDGVLGLKVYKTDEEMVQSHNLIEKLGKTFGGADGAI